MRARALGNRAAACASVTSGLEIRASAAIYSPSSATRMLTVCSRLFRTHTHSTHAHFRAAARLMCPRIKIYVHITRAHLSIISLCVAKRICTNAKCTTKRLSRRAHAKEKFNDLLPSAHGTHTSHPPHPSASSLSLQTGAGACFIASSSRCACSWIAERLRERAGAHTRGCAVSWRTRVGVCVEHVHSQKGEEEWSAEKRGRTTRRRTGIVPGRRCRLWTLGGALW